MGYRPNLSARNLQRGATRCVGIVMAFIDHYPLHYLFSLISQVCLSRGYHAVPLPMERRLDKNAEQLHLLETAHVDGLIMLDFHAPARQQYEKLIQQNYPMVFRAHEPLATEFNVSHVRLNRVAAYRKLTRYILDRGWTNIYISVEADPDRPPLDGEGQYFMGPRMTQVLRSELPRLDPPVDLSTREIRVRSRRAEDRYEATRRFLRQRPLAPGTCIIHDGGDGISGTYAAIAGEGLRVGRDIAVAALSAPPRNEFVQPAPTMLAEPYEQVAESLVDMLLGKLKKTGGDGAKSKTTIRQFELQLIFTDTVPVLPGSSEVL
jgi:LacI family transcriptional regulator